MQWVSRAYVKRFKGKAGWEPARCGCICGQGECKAEEQVLQIHKARQKKKCGSSRNCKGTGVFCMGDDDGQYKHEGRLREEKMHHSRLPVKGV